MVLAAFEVPAFDGVIVWRGRFFIASRIRFDDEPRHYLEATAYSIPDDEEPVSLEAST